MFFFRFYSQSFMYHTRRNHVSIQLNIDTADSSSRINFIQKTGNYYKFREKKREKTSVYIVYYIITFSRSHKFTTSYVCNEFLC